jgi:hypothetical protein
MAATFFFHLRCMMRRTLPTGLKVVWAPQVVSPVAWMSVLAADSLSYMMIRRS